MDNEYQGEEWRDIEGYEGLYQISNLGRLKSLKRGKPRISNRTLSGRYLTTTLTNHHGDRRPAALHRLVAAAFLGECPAGHEVHHIDHNPSNNRLDNLQYVTHKENVNFAIPKIKAANQEKARLALIKYHELNSRVEIAVSNEAMSVRLAAEHLRSLIGRSNSVITQVDGMVNTFDIYQIFGLKTFEIHRLASRGVSVIVIDEGKCMFRLTWHTRE